MKLWKDMSHEERQERLGDPSVDRSAQRSEYEAMLIDRFQNGLPLSKHDTVRARKLLKGA